MIRLKVILSGLILTSALSACSDSVPGAIKPGDTINSSAYSNSDYKKFILKHSYKVSSATAENISGLVTYYSKNYGVDPKLVISLMAIESGFNINAVSSVGAAGLGQLMPGTAKDMGVTNRFSAQDNIKGTVKYLSYLSKKNKGNIDKTLASYNMGPNAVDNIVKSGKQLPSDVKRYVANIKYYYYKA